MRETIFARVAMVAVCAWLHACGDSEVCFYETLDSSISSDTTLDGCYDVTRTINVEDGALLSIAPGTILRFAQDARLEVKSDGALSATGSAAEPILFTGAQETRGYWQGVRFNGTDDIDNVLAYVTIEYAGGGYYSSQGDDSNLMVSNARVSITNSTLRQSAGNGFYFYQANITGFGGNTVTGNAWGAGYLYGNDAGELSDTSSYSGNDKDYVELQRDTLETDQVWPAIDVPYLVRQMAVEAQLTIAAGATLHFEQDQGMQIKTGGALTAVGTAAAPVVFSGAQETRGYWQGIYFTGTDDIDNRMEHVVVEYGGGSYFSSSGDNSNVKASNSTLTIANATIRESDGYGISNYNSTITMSDITYENNAGEDYYEE